MPDVYDQQDPGDETDASDVVDRIVACTAEGDADTRTWREREPERVRAWRCLMFEQAGCASFIAELLADDAVDTHEFRSLLARGCSVEVAAGILR